MIWICAGRGSTKLNCHIRITHLPTLFSISKPSINEINSVIDESAHSSFIQFCGTITRTSGIRMLEVSKQYQCQNLKCKYRFTVFADPEQGNMLPQPRTCPSRAQDGSKPCNSTSIRELEGSRKCVDYQEIRVQDKIEHLQFGAIPRTIIVTVEADLVDQHRPGDDVIIVGTIIRQWKPVLRSARISIELAIRAHSIRAMAHANTLKVRPIDMFWISYITTHDWRLESAVE
jgi:DNA helicase MCM9